MVYKSRMANIGENIRRIRKHKKLTLEQVAIPSGTDTGNLSRIERGLQGAPEDLLDRIAAVLGVPAWVFMMQPETLIGITDKYKNILFAPDESHYASISDLVCNAEAAPTLRPFRNVPIVGLAQGGDNGYFTELEYPVGQGDGDITYPAKDENSYALRVRGDSMRPRIKNGEFIIVEPNHQPQPGDDVVVCLEDGRKMVKELLYIRDGDITLGSINNGHGNITVALSSVEKMHYVAAIVPRGAFYKSNVGGGGVAN